MTPEKVIRDGNVAVLVSPGFGAGWSSLSDGDAAQMLAFDRRFVEAREAGVSDIEPIAKEVFGDTYICILGWSDVRIEWLPKGTAFAIEEYDGSEIIRTLEDLAFVA